MRRQRNELVILFVGVQYNICMGVRAMDGSCGKEEHHIEMRMNHVDCKLE